MTAVIDPRPTSPLPRSANVRHRIRCRARRGGMVLIGRPMEFRRSLCKNICGGADMVQPVTETGLYWSSRGEVACPRHASRISVDRWQSEGWVPLPRSSQGYRGMQFQCQHCSPNRTALVHRAVTGTPWSDLADAALARSRARAWHVSPDPHESPDDGA